MSSTTNNGLPDWGPLDPSPVQSAEIPLACQDLGPTFAFFTAQLGFRLETIFPADDPAVAVVAGHGLRLRLQRDPSAGEAPPVTIRLLCRDPAAVAGGRLGLTAPNGTRIELAEADPEAVLPPLRPAFLLQRQDAAAAWVTGRAGMHYRDLIPDRQGGRFIASHIRIPRAGRCRTWCTTTGSVSK